MTVGQGQWAAAEQILLPLFRRLETFTAPTEEETRARLVVMNSLAVIYTEQERYPEAEKLFLETLKLAESTPEEAQPMHESEYARNLLSMYRTQKRWKHAEELHREMIASATATLGAQDRVTLCLMHNLTMGPLYQQQRWAAAEELEMQVAEGIQKIHGPEEETTNGVLANLAEIRSRLAEGGHGAGFEGAAEAHGSHL